jgi:hypothetical protein
VEPCPHPDGEVREALELLSHADLSGAIGTRSV